MDRPGVVRVFCDIHSHMNAFVLVFNHPFFDVTDVDGRFELPSLPAGTYTVVGWYEGEARITRPVVVPPAAGRKSIWSCRDARARLDHQSHLSRQRAAGHALDRRGGVFRQRAHDHAKPKPSCSAI